jgi:Ca2+-binding EF-hand superfamily protein
MNIEDRIARMRAERGAQTQAAPAEKRVRVEQLQREVVAEQAPSSEKVFDIANNTVAKIMDRSDLSDEGKLEAVVAFLSAEYNNYNAAEKNFAQFEAYFTYEQSRRTQVSEQHIDRLMGELQDGTKSTIEHILKDFNKVNDGAGNIKKLLRVMEKARVDGTTVEVLTNAFRVNETLLRDISALKAVLADEKSEEAQAQSRLRNYQREGEEGLLNNFLHMFGADVRESESVYYSQSRLESIKEKIQKCQATISEKESQRNKKLEDGELTILRTVDATEGGFTDQIVQTAKDSLALITGTRVSIEKLLAANAKSRAASTEITNVLNSATGRETILKGALELVAKETRLQGESLGAEVGKLTQEKAEAAGNAAQFTLATVKLDKMRQTGQSASDYEHVLETRVISFGMLASANVQAEARAQQFSTLVESHHELLSNLQQQALPVTASALEMGLQQGVALRDGLLAAGVRDATKKAQLIFGANLAGATEAQTTLESENLNQMRAAIAALGKAQALINERTDKAIEHGLASMDLVEKVTASADAVSAALSDFQKVGAVLASRDDGVAAPPTP